MRLLWPIYVIDSRTCVSAHHRDAWFSLAKTTKPTKLLKVRFELILMIVPKSWREREILHSSNHTHLWSYYGFFPTVLIFLALILAIPRGGRKTEERYPTSSEMFIVYQLFEQEISRQTLRYKKRVQLFHFSRNKDISSIKCTLSNSTYHV